MPILLLPVTGVAGGTGAVAAGVFAACAAAPAGSAAGSLSSEWDWDEPAKNFRKFFKL